MSNDNLKIYTEDEALQASIEYFNGDEMAAGVWLKKYALRDRDGKLYEKTPDMMHRRIAKELARIDKKYPNPQSEEHYFELLKDFKYVVPQGSPMAGIGNEHQTVSLSNCFVVNNEDGDGDSYGSILKIDQELVQVMKRRGGCIEENSLVYIQGKGLVPIKDVNIGDFVLSFNDKTHKDEFKLITDKFLADVKTDEQVKITYSDGSVLRTSSKHPVTTLTEDGVVYKSINDGLSINDVGFNITNNIDSDIYDYDNNLSDIGWLIGFHMGDGTLDISKDGTYRTRVNGDEEETIKKYSKIWNYLSGSNCGYRISKRKDYKSNVWEYSQCSNSTEGVVNKYFDGYVGSKTYNGRVPSFISDNNLWIPYIAGLIDSDGHVKRDGKIEISMCMKPMLDLVVSVLASNGISYTYSEKKPSKINESMIYKLSFGRKTDDDFIKGILKHIIHVKKKDIISNNSFLKKYHSRKIILPDNEFEMINESYNNINIKNNSTSAIMKLVRKTKNIGLAGMYELLKTGVVDEDYYNNYKSRVYIKSIEYEKTDGLVYWDINVNDNHNYYAGTVGLVNIHNCGTDLSQIRPNESIVNNSAMTSTGVGAFMERYSNTTREVAQAGRRGALMLSINISHPDAEDFVDIKMEAGKVTGANISVKITDDFMEVVKRTTKEDVERYDKFHETEDWSKDEMYELDLLKKKILYTQTFEYSDGSVMKKQIIAKKLWDKIIFNAWKSAEPGVLFWDKIIRESPADCYKSLGFETVSTNPCGEIPLADGGSCRLTLLNLYSYVDNPFTPQAKFNFDLFKKHTHQITRVMDNIVDMELEKIDSIIAKVKSDPESDLIKQPELNLWNRIKDKGVRGRRTGIGVTAEGDMLASLGYIYGTPEATKFSEKVHSIYATEVLRESTNLSKERGSFPIWDWEMEKNNPYLNRIYENNHDVKDLVKKYGRRNIANMTIAPAGSVSILTQTTSGIEPAFLVNYTRRRKINPQEKGVRVDFVDEVGDSWTEYNVFHHKFIDWFSVNQLELRKRLGEEQVEIYPMSWCKDFLENLDKESTQKLIEWSPYYKAMANDVDWVEKVRMQGAVQKWIDHSISVTVNLPEHVDTDLVNDVYITAWESGCKGCTIYRDGSRSGVLITKEEKKEEKIKQMFEDSHAPKRPKRLDCDVIHFMNKGEKWICFVGLMEGRPYEIFTGSYDKLSDVPSSVERGIIERRKNNGLSQYMFIYKDKNGDDVECCDLKHTFDEAFADVSKMVSAILRHGMPLEYVVDLLDNLNLDGDLITTWKAGVKRIIKRYVREGSKAKGKCPECNSSNLAYQDSCLTCMDCGNSKCG